MPSYTLPVDTNNRPASGGYTPAIGVITLQTGTPTTDGNNVTSAPLNVVLVPDSGTFREQSALSAGYQGAFLVPMTDVSAFKWLSLHITGDYNGTLAFQISNDGQNWDPYPMYQQSIPGVLLPSVTNLTGIFGGPVIARYFQVQLVAYSSGIATGVLELYVVPPALPTAIAPAGIKVDGSGVTQPVVGVVTINTSNQAPIPISGNITTSDASVGTIGGAAPVSASLIGGSDGTNLHGLLVDASGNLKVNVAAGGGSGGTSSSFSATFPATGTAIGASDGTNMKALLVDASGYLKVNVAAGGGAGGTSSSFTAAFPSTGTAIGASDGTTMQALQVDGSKNLKVTIASGSVTANAGTGTFNDASVGTTGSATPASASLIGASDGTNLHGLLVDGSGYLKVNVAAGGGAGGTSSSFSSAFPSTGTAIGASDGTNMKALLVDGSGYLKVNVAAGGASGGTALADDTTFTAGTTSLTPSGGVYNDSIASATSGHADAVRITAKRAFHTNLRDSSGNELLGSKTSANSVPVVIASDQGTLTISGTVTANAGTGPFPVAGMVASGSSNANNPVKVGGVFNTTQPTVTTGQMVDAQYSARGAALVATGTDTFNVTVNAALPTGSNTIGAVTQASGPWTSNITQVGGSSIVTGGASGLIAVGGPVASGSSNADNPVKMGGVFNTTQPTVTNGQIVDAQYSARGAAIVATGTDTFNVTVNAALPTGSNTIGAVTQASGPWTQNITQFGGTNIATGTGASGTGIPRVTVANDSQVQLWDGTNKANVFGNSQASENALYTAG